MIKVHLYQYWYPRKSKKTLSIFFKVLPLFSFFPWIFSFFNFIFFNSPKLIALLLIISLSSSIDSLDVKEETDIRWDGLGFPSKLIDFVIFSSLRLEIEETTTSSFLNSSVLIFTFTPSECLLSSGRGSDPLGDRAWGIDGRLLVVVRLILCFLFYWTGILGVGPAGLACWEEVEDSSLLLSSHFFFFGEGLVMRDLLALNLFSLLLFLCIWIWCSTSTFFELKNSLKLLEPWVSSFFYSLGGSYMATGSFTGETSFSTGFGELKVIFSFVWGSGFLLSAF